MNNTYLLLNCCDTLRANNGQSPSGNCSSFYWNSWTSDGFSCSVEPKWLAIRSWTMVLTIRIKAELASISMLQYMGSVSSAVARLSALFSTTKCPIFMGCRFSFTYHCLAPNADNCSNHEWQNIIEKLCNLLWSLTTFTMMRTEQKFPPAAFSCW